MAFLCQVHSIETDYQREALYRDQLGRSMDNCLEYFKMLELHRDFDMKYLEYTVKEVPNNLETLYRLKGLEIY